MCGVGGGGGGGGPLLLSPRYGVEGQFGYQNTWRNKGSPIFAIQYMCKIFILHMGEGNFHTMESFYTSIWIFRCPVLIIVIYHACITRGMLATGEMWLSHSYFSQWRWSDSWLCMAAFGIRSNPAHKHGATKRPHIVMSCRHESKQVHTHTSIVE